jgi:hypothetical protein
MALYSTRQHSICIQEFIHGCYAILIVYQSMLTLFMSCVKYMVSPNDLCMDIGLFCFPTYSSILLVHAKGGRPGDARALTLYMGALLEYAGSYEYDFALLCEWGRRQVVIALSIHYNSCVAVIAFPNVGVW